MTLYYYLPFGTDPRPLIVRTEPIRGFKLVFVTTEMNGRQNE